MPQRTHDSERISDQDSRPKPNQREYGTPHLTVYGDLSQLTTGGSKAKHENNTEGGMTKS
jgi:hypothetical protein